MPTPPTNPSQPSGPSVPPGLPEFLAAAQARVRAGGGILVYVPFGINLPKFDGDSLYEGKPYAGWTFIHVPHMDVEPVLFFLALARNNVDVMVTSLCRNIDTAGRFRPGSSAERFAEILAEVRNQPGALDGVSTTMQMRFPTDPDG